MKASWNPAEKILYDQILAFLGIPQALRTKAAVGPKREMGV